MTRFLRLFSLPMILLTISGGCATVGTPADLYQRIADRMQEKAKAMMCKRNAQKMQKQIGPQDMQQKCKRHPKCNATIEKCKRNVKQKQELRNA